MRATVAALARGYRFALDDPESSEQDLGRPGSLNRLDAALLGDAGRPGVLDTKQIRAYARWAHTTFPVDASAGQG